VLLVLASLIRRKGIDVLLDALASERNPGIVLWIAGEGPERAALEAQAERLGLAARARFLGRREDAADLLAACDVYVLPSRREGLGVSALEAMAARRPVIATRVGGLADAVADERTGILVPPEDAAELARAIARVAADPALRLRLGEAGPARLGEGFLASQMVGAYEKLYRTVLEERRRP
jgi:glycosyltransferase involved in cell wall biosynthesis